MNFDFQPTDLSNDLIALRPIQESDFDALFQAASDPLIWAQHPNPNRYQRPDFENYFKGAIESKGAFVILDTQNQQVIGSSRYYDLDVENRSVIIGYTFLARAYWGGKYNPSLKKLMLDHAFRYVDKVLFHVGSMNIRSQTAIGRLGAVKIGEQAVAYYGEAPKLNFIYQITKPA